MKKEEDYIRDISEIRTIMERSTKFLSLSGWSGILAGVYALVGVYFAYDIFSFTPGELEYDSLPNGQMANRVFKFLIIGAAVLVLAISTAIFLSFKRAKKRRDKLWNPAARRLVSAMAVPLISGGLLVLILLSKGLVELVAPLTLIFYGLALYSACRFTYEEVKYLGYVQIILGLLSAHFVAYGLLFWAVGFGVMHIIYGIYMHLRYER